MKPRDKLFGFRGLLTSAASPTIETNYRKATSEIFVGFATSVMTLAESCWTVFTWAVDWEEMIAQDWKEHIPFSFLGVASP